MFLLYSTFYAHMNANDLYKSITEFEIFNLQAT